MSIQKLDMCSETLSLRKRNKFLYILSNAKDAKTAPKYLILHHSAHFFVERHLDLIVYEAVLNQ